ncbi:MAG: alpha-amylase family glycosyl hydrolase, partial [Acutalibacteraceae bacterium]|nr:alpha-amylase family glycosyl hydrolase [Acutalibacteraceae bacterium]
MYKKLIIGALTVMFTFSNVFCTLNVSAEENASAKAKELDKLAYSGDDLGAIYTPESTTFKVWSPTASEVSLNLYKTGSDNEDGAEKLDSSAMNYNETNGVWSITVEGDLKNVYYTYSVKNGDTVNETVDIYAKAAGVNGNRGMVVDLDSTDPENWDSDKRVLPDSSTEAIVWEVHVRDFSNQSSSGISEEHRGKFLAFTEDGTVLEGSDTTSTGIDYLKKLGVTHVQINPFYDFGSIDETKPNSDDYNWGYDPKNYNVPEGSYSTNPYDGNVRINEAKQMIQALHNAGIGVIMDVVYNHTYT